MKTTQSIDTRAYYSAYRMLKFLCASKLGDLILRCLAACHDNGLEYNQTDIIIAIRAHLRTSMTQVSIDQSQISQALTRLRKYGLITREYRGQRCIYRIVPDRINQINRIAADISQK